MARNHTLIRFSCGMAAALSGASALAIASATPAFAQDGAREGLDEITVTAQRREENQQEVPISVTTMPEDRLAAILAGAMMICVGIVTLVRMAGVRVPHMPVPKAMQNVVRAGHRASLRWKPVHRALLTGLLTTLLPCGWLYAFAITASGTGSPLWGAVTMAAFWFGTLPIMLSLGLSFQVFTGPLRKRLPLVTSLLLVAVGLGAVFGRSPIAAAESATGEPSTESLITRVRSLDSSESSCCEGH